MYKLQKNISVWSLVALILTLFSLQYAHSQSIMYGKITGTVTDESGEPLPGVTVEILSEALISRTRSTVTSDKGSFVFLNLPVGKYNLAATLEGFKTALQENIAISIGSSITVHLKMEAGAIEETITVTAESPIVEARSSTIATSIEGDLLEKIPTSRDAFYDLALSAPGMVSQGKDGDWLPSPNAYGGSSNENVFLINGVNTTNPRAASYGSLLQVNYDAVEEVRVIALGSKAEYGNFTGVAIDVLTKSGSNNFHGNLAIYSILGKAENNQPGKNVNLGKIGDIDLFITEGDEVVKRDILDWEGNFTLGGPVVKDKVWFYGGFNYVRTETQVPFFPVNSNSWGRFGDIKITAEPWLNHRTWIAYHYENNNATGTTWDPHWDATMSYGTKSVNHSISSQWQWFASGRTIFTAKYLGFWSNDKPYIPDDAPDYPGYINWWKPGPHGVNGAFPYVEAQKSSRNTVQADISHYAEDFLGEHDIKFGVQYTIGRGNWMGGYFHGYANFVYPYRWCYNFYYYQSWYGDTAWKWYNMQIHLNPFLTVRTSNQLGFFLDDQWTPTKRLTLNFGLRFDNMKAKYGKGKVYEMPSSPNAINDPPPVIRDRQGTDYIFDFKNWAPRIGISYALTGDMKTVFRASYGRYFLPISIEYLRRFGPDMPEAQRHWMFYEVPFVDLDGDDEVDLEDATEAARYLHDTAPYEDWWDTTDYSWRLNVADDLKNQHTDQFTFNLERELFNDFSASITYIYKRTTDIFVNWPLNKETGEEWEYERVPYTTEYGQQLLLYGLVFKDYNGDGSIDGDDIQWIRDNADYEVRNMPEIDGHKPQRTYQGLQFVLKKRYSNRWQMLASFLYATSNGMAGRTRRQDFNFEGPMVMDDTWLKDFNQTLNNMKGPLPFTQKYEFKLSGSYKIPALEVDLGFRFRYNSGRPIWPLESVPVHSPWGNPPGSVILPHSQASYVVSIDPKDPWYLPAEKILDLRFDRAFKLSDSSSIHIALDVLNVFNEATITNAGYGGEMEPVTGKVSGITFPSRKMRLSLRFQF